MASGANFAKTSTGYFNVDAIAFITQQLGGAYRIRFTDGMVQVVTEDDGKAVMRAIGKVHYEGMDETERNIAAGRSPITESPSDNPRSQKRKKKTA